MNYHDYFGGTMKSINVVRGGLFFNKTELVVYILALFTFVLLILTFTQNKKRYLFQDQDLLKAHFLKSQYSESYKSNSEFIEDLSKSVSVDNKSLIPGQSVMEDEKISTSKDDRLVAKSLAYPARIVNNPLPPTDDGGDVRHDPEPNNTKSITSTTVSMEDRPDDGVEGKLTNSMDQPQDQKIARGHETKIQLNQQKAIHHYRVKKGDCMSSIANKYHIPLTKLLRYNPVKNPNLIYVGSMISIPGSN